MGLQQNSPYQNIDFGTQPTTAKLETINVCINPDIILADFSKAYALEVSRRNPVRAKTVGLTAEELQDYFESLCALRCQSIHGDGTYWRQAKRLAIPSWVQFVLTEIGEVIDVDRGLRFIPVFEKTIDMEKLMETSNKLRSFESDGLHLEWDAMPRDIHGDAEVMSFQLVENYVMGMTKTFHPIASYVAAFLGFKVKEASGFNALYRVRYDDIEFVKAMLLNTKEVF